MPAESKDQQRAAAVALRAKKGEIKVSELKGASLQMYNSMSAAKLEKLAKTKHSSLPEKVDEATTVSSVGVGGGSKGSGSYETPFGAMNRRDMHRLESLKESYSKARRLTEGSGKKKTLKKFVIGKAHYDAYVEAVRDYLKNKFGLDPQEPDEESITRDMYKVVVGVDVYSENSGSPQTVPLYFYFRMDHYYVSMFGKQSDKYTKGQEISFFLDYVLGSRLKAKQIYASPPMGVSRDSDKKQIKDQKQPNMKGKLKEEKQIKITLEAIERIVKKTLIREEVYSQKADGKGKETSTKNAKATKKYDSNAGKATRKSTTETGKQSKKATKEMGKKASDFEKNNLSDEPVKDVNEAKLQNDDYRKEAYQNGMEDLTYDNITPDQQKRNTELYLNKKAYDDPAATDNGVHQQMLDDAKDRLETKESSKFRKAKVYGDDVTHIDDADSAQTKGLAFETVKRYNFKKPFKNAKNMLGRIPSKGKINEHVFQMADGDNKYTLRWEGNSKSGVPVILEHYNEKKDVAQHNRFEKLTNHLMTENTTQENSEASEGDVFRQMMNESREISGLETEEKSGKDLLEHVVKNKRKYISSDEVIAKKYGWEIDFYREMFGGNE